MKRPASLLVVALAVLALGVGPAHAATVTITPGAVWTDTSGGVIQAHGEGVTKVGGTYYWIGEDKTNGSPFQNIRCYSSTDLRNWTFVGNLLTRQSSGDLGPNRVVERPHVIYNAATATYVMYMHIDNSSYTERKAGVATSSSVCGSYTYRGSFKPLGHDSLDDNLFLDGSTAYLLSEDRTNAKLQIYRLSADFLSVAALVKTLPQYESPAMVKVGGTYFLFGSHLTGWNTNDNQYATATSIEGTWSSWRSFAPAGTNTCNSQVTTILPVTGSAGTSYVYLGDRWNPGNLTDSRYVWLPLTISGTTASMTCQTSWTIDAATGSIGSGGATYYRITAQHSGRVMDVYGVSTTDSAEVKQWSWNGGANQRWAFEDAGGGYYRVVSQNSGKCLDVSGASTADGANIIQYTCTGGANQQWQWRATGSYFQLVARHSGKCLDVVSADTADGADIQQYACGSGANQQWTRAVP
ncbi:RICIN domain-containing protein [Luedemannella flava]|uniref:RICIN domain-containing protein n=1 Tax=Luedemannella flava TaxID=349316 RepID=A0ABP4XLM9_9ACTN